MIINLYDVKLSAFLKVVSAGYECQGHKEGMTVYNVDQIRCDESDLLLIINGKSIMISRKDFRTLSIV